MPWVYVLKGSSGRYYIGSAVDLDARFAQHLRGQTATTKRLGEKFKIVAKKETKTLVEARELERILKRRKNPKLAIYHLQQYSSPESIRGWLRTLSEFSPLAAFLSPLSIER
jgi:predicted GIY-YIG superfamily endonuclease